MKKVFRNKYGELRSGWTLPLAFIFTTGVSGPMHSFVMLILTVFGLDVASEAAAMPLMMLSRTLQGLGMIGGSILLFWLLFRRIPHEMGYVRAKWLPSLGIGLLIGIGSIAAVFLVLVLSGQAVILAVDFSILLRGEFWGWFYIFAVAAMAEEASFRGLMMSCAKTMRIPALILVVPACFFSYLHAANANVSLLAFVNIFLAGIWLGIIFWRSGSLWMAYGAHFAWNFFQGTVLGMNVSGIDTASVITTQFVGDDLFTGGAFGAEGGLAATGILLVSTALIFFLCRKPAPGGWTMTGGLPLIDKLGA